LQGLSFSRAVYRTAGGSWPGGVTRTNEGVMNSRSILITGCSSGIGYDAAISLHKRGWQVFATCRQVGDVARLRAEGLHASVLDLAVSSSIETAVAEVVEQTGGRLDALFNNGAFAVPGLVEDLPRDALRDIFETNVFGQIELTNHVLPIMRQQNHGRVVMCSSVLGFAAAPFRGAYIATKYALEGITDTLRLELIDSPIDIILIEPGPIGTRIRQNSVPHFERWIDIAASAQRERYEHVMKPRLYKTDGPKDRFELPPSAVTQKLINALESRRPKPRYYVTVPTYLAGILKRFTSTRLFDSLCNR